MIILLLKKSVNQFSFKIYLYFWLVHVIGDCSNFILCDVLYLSSEKISFLSQTSVKISRKAFYQVVNNDENSSYGTVQYSFCQQKKCLELFWQDMETSLLSCFCRFFKLEWFIKISLKQRLYIISSDFNYLSVRFLHSSRSKLKCSSHLCGQTKELRYARVVFFWSFSFQMEWCIFSFLGSFPVSKVPITAHVRHSEAFWSFFYIWFGSVSLCLSLPQELRDNGTVKKLPFCPKSLGVKFEFQHIERGLLTWGAHKAIAVCSKIEVSIVLQTTWLNYQLRNRMGYIFRFEFLISGPKSYLGPVSRKSR